MKKVWHELQIFFRGDIGKNTIFREHMKDEQICSVNYD